MADVRHDVDGRAGDPQPQTAPMIASGMVSRIPNGCIRASTATPSRDKPERSRAAARTAASETVAHVLALTRKEGVVPTGTCTSATIFSSASTAAPRSPWARLAETTALAPGRSTHLAGPIASLTSPRRKRHGEVMPGLTIRLRTPRRRGAVSTLRTSTSISCRPAYSAWQLARTLLTTRRRYRAHTSQLGARSWSKMIWIFGVAGLDGRLDVCEAPVGLHAQPNRSAASRRRPVVPETTNSSGVESANRLGRLNWYCTPGRLSRLCAARHRGFFSARPDPRTT